MQILRSLNKSNFWQPALLIAVCFWIGAAHYQPGLWLSGWDSLHPEFDLPLYLRRAFWGVWQEHQGVGAVASQAHAAELTRLPVIWLLSMVLPLTMVRFSFFFLTLIIGALGLYFLAQDVLKGFRFGKLSSFLGSLFYLLNLATVQQYYVPLEMFAVNFAALPWLFKFGTSYLIKGRKRYLGLFSLATLLSTSQAHTPTLFYTYFVCLVGFVGFWFIQERTWQILKKATVLITMTLSLNAFWLLPNLYYGVNHANSVVNSKIHNQFSSEAFLRSKSYGTFADLSLFKNFLFSAHFRYDFEKGEFLGLLDEWSVHLDRPWVTEIGYVFFGLATLGLVVAAVRKSKVGVSLIPVVAITTFFWINQNPPFEPAFNLLIDRFPLILEVLRFPFTKFSFLLTMSAAIYFSYLLACIFQKIRLSILISFFVILILSAFGYFMKPVFEGHMISSSMRVSIPNEYFQMFDWFKKQKEGRVAKLPLHTFWGWNFYSWGYQGAGFTWFGIRQPSLDREFDRWNPQNESFYNEASFALYNGSGADFERVLDKYNVAYLLLDESVLNAGGSADLLKIDEIKKILEDSESIRLAKQFGYLSVYETDFGKGDVWVPREITKVNANLTYAQEDPVYTQVGNYVGTRGAAVYPFANTDKRVVDYKLEGDSIVLVYNLPQSVPAGSSLFIPDYLVENQKLPLEVLASRTQGGFKLTLKLNLPEILVDSKPVYGGPITFSNTYDVDDVYAVEINGKIFKVGQVDTNQRSLGVVLVNLQDDISIKIFSNNNRRSQIATTNRFYLQDPRWCSNPNNITPLSLEDGVFSLAVKDKSICLGTYFVVGRTSLYEVSFDTKSSSGNLPSFCITKGDGCLGSSETHEHLEGWTRYSYRAVLEPGNYWMDVVGLPLRSTSFAGEESSKPVTYWVRNFAVETMQISVQRKYSIKDSLSLFTGDKTLSLDQDFDEISVKIPLKSIESEKFGPGRGVVEANNCDLKKSGEVSKDITSRGIIYRASSGGVSCDFFDYKDLTNADYYLTIAGQNEVGRSLKIYLQNLDTGRLDVEELLPKGKFAQVFPVLTSSTKKEGYTLNLETRSFGRIPSVNRLESINFVYAPHSWLVGVRIGDLEKVIDNDLTVENTQKINPSLYRVAVSGSGVLALNQGYEDGWIGLDLTNKKVIEHVKLNSWANGFLVETSQSRSKLVEASSKAMSDVAKAGQLQPVSTTVLIFFWPQLLEFLGLIALIVFAIRFFIAKN